MSTKQFKLFKYIVDDMMRDTEVNYPGKYIKFPFLPRGPYYHKLVSDSYSQDTTHYSFFIKHCKIYALSNMEEKMLWTKYRERINRELRRQRRIVKEIERRLENGESIDGIEF